MRIIITLALALTLTAAAGTALACDAGVTFDGLAAGTTYGLATGFQPGDVLFVENGITVTAHRFAFAGGGFGYGSATIGNSLGAPIRFDRRRICNENNINLRFDLSGLGLVVTRVTFHWLDMGGFENLRVNGGAPYIGELDMAPAAIAAGIAYAVNEVPVPGGKKGESVLLGPVSSFAVGGQEFAIDSICVEGYVPRNMEEARLMITIPDGDDDAPVATEQDTWGGVKALYR
jgi:hypothetical protein